jgi:hypothetical protein
MWELNWWGGGFDQYFMRWVETRNACWKFATCQLNKEWNYNIVRSLGNCEDEKWIDQAQDCILWPVFFS